jgi:phosphatidylserine/phosphatidylglycerophosphate/cardiolipin synthase-like enzyme
MVLSCAKEVADLLERQQAAFEARRSETQIVATIPEFLHLARNHALPPIQSDSLEAAMMRVVHSARRTLDLSIPYISNAGVKILMKGLRPGSRRHLRVRILSLLTSEHLEQNSQGVCELAQRFERLGARVEIRSPTDEEALEAGAIAVMHAKIIVADSMYSYLGTANISKGALIRAFEVGVIMKGALAKNLANLIDWIYRGHQPWRLPLDGQFRLRRESDSR